MTTLKECKDFLHDREWINLFQTTKHCPLSMNARIILGYLRRRMKAEKAPDYQTISRATGINRDRSTPKAVAELIGHKLATRDDKGFRCLDPGEEHQTWFAQRSDGKGCRFFRVYLLPDPSKDKPIEDKTTEDKPTEEPKARSSNLTPQANLFYWLMVNINEQKLSDGTSRLLKNKKIGLAVILGIPDRTQRTAFTLLKELNLIAENNKGLHVFKPNDSSLWRERESRMKGKKPGQDLWSKEPAAFVGVGKEDSRTSLIERWEGIHGEDDEQISFLIDRLETTWALLRASGYYQSDALHFLDYIKEQVRDIHHALMYLAYVPEHLKQADAWHKKKGGRYRCSLYVLKGIARKRGLLATMQKSA